MGSVKARSVGKVAPPIGRPRQRVFGARKAPGQRAVQTPPPSLVQRPRTLIGLPSDWGPHVHSRFMERDNSSGPYCPRARRTASTGSAWWPKTYRPIAASNVGRSGSASSDVETNSICQ
jgi:hypothetical protein